MMKRLVPLVLLAALPILFLSSCGDNDKVTGLSLTSGRADLTTAETFNLKAVVSPKNLSDISLQWESSNESVVAVEGPEITSGNTASAVITAVSPGEGTIIVTSQNGSRATCSVTVEDPIEVESITLSSDKLSLLVGSSDTLSADVLPLEATSKLSWESSDPDVARVNANTGEITGREEGTAIITATAADQKAQCLVTVHKMTPEYLDVAIAEQPFRVTSTTYSIQSDTHKALYPDMMQVMLKNDTELNIQNAYIAFVAWDKNGLPVKIKKAHFNPDGGAYIAQVTYDNINMVPGSSYGNDCGFQVDDECGIADFKAIVYAYEAFDGTSWQNPYYSDWRKLYEGKEKP